MKKVSVVASFLVGATIMALAAVLAIATPALGFTGPPVTNDHFSFTSTPQDSDFCGVPGTDVDRVVEHFIQDASGNFIDNVHVSQLFTATATGNTILSTSDATTRTTGPIDNGDGTISFVTNITGQVLHFQILNGPMLKAANGEPIRSAGILTITDIFDATTGDYITTTQSFHGPHLVREGVDICGPAIDYLMDP